MLTTILAILFFGLLFAGMAIGVIFANKPVKGSCGGIGASGVCGVCGKTEACEDEEKPAELPVESINGNEAPRN